MARRFLTSLLVSLALVNFVLLCPSRAASADMIRTSPVQETGSAGAKDRQEVASSLAGAGLSDAEIASRVDQLSSEEVANLADNPKQLQMAGAPLALVSIIALGVLLVVVLVWIETVNQKAKKDVQK
ncbi:MAG: hypothetical protein HYZ53_07725 [Planctomycetes bacterium]|nr:hypothetical protein [Planctomycetota bacterium]